MSELLRDQPYTTPEQQEWADWVDRYTEEYDRMFFRILNQHLNLVKEPENGTTE